MNTPTRDTAFEIKGISDLLVHGSEFCVDLDAMIIHLEQQVELLKLLRGATARTFGIDRPKEGSFVQKLTTGANRSQLEGEQKAGAV